MQDEFLCSLLYIVFNCFQFISVRRSQLEQNFNAVCRYITLFNTQDWSPGVDRARYTKSRDFFSGIWNVKYII